jgi:phospholipase/carboxylesterase
MNQQEILDYPEIKSANVKATKLMVLMHGLGSDGHDLISLAPFIQQHFPDYHFISPHGVEAFDMAPFGRQWFSLQDRDPEAIMELVKESSKKTREIIKKKTTRTQSN